MKRQPANHRFATVILLAAIVLAFSSSVARSDVHLAILPESLPVDPGEVFDVELTITEEGSAFNGYDAVIGFDPDYLIFVEQPWEDQEGPLMTDACPTRFHEFEISPDGDVLTVHHVLLCAGVSVTGPGVVYRLRFEAGSQNGQTDISFLDGTAFFLAGVEVTPVLTGDAVITIRNITDVPQTPIDSGLNLRAAPNPFNPMTLLSFEVPRAGSGQLAVYTADGRRIRLLTRDYLGEGHHEFMWDGMNDRGQMVSSGVYYVQLRVGDRSDMRPVTLVK